MTTSGNSAPTKTAAQLRAEIGALKAELAALKGESAAAGAAAVAGDSTDRLAAEESLRESEDRFRSVAERSPSMIFINQGGRIVYANPKSEEILGYSVAELCAPDFDFRRLIAPEALELVGEMYRRHQQGQEIEQYEYAVVCKDGRHLEVINATRLIRYGGKPAILGVVTDISDLVRARKALQESERRYRTLVETCPDSIVVIGLDGKFLMANDEAARHQGYETAEQLLAAGRTSFDSLAPEAREQAMQDFRRVLREGRVTNSVFETITMHGKRAVAESNASLIRDEDGTPKAIMAVTRDITERRLAEERRLELERQILHAQKLESLGLLAGGIAHDFNNLLTSILGSANLAAHHLDDPEVARKNLERVLAATKRASDLTSQMLAYSGKGSRKVRPVRIEEIVGDMVDLLEVSVPKKVRLRFEHGAELPSVLADSAQLQQVILNLLTNAAEAIDEEGGDIVVRTGLSDPDGARSGDAPRGGDGPEAPCVCIEVADTGCGMDADTRAHIFEPFFSTKFAGRGLGLAAVSGIIRSHKGAIVVDSKPNEGTTVRVFFPTDPSAVPATRRSDAREGDFASQGTVLVVDDEKMVRDVAGDMIESTGLATLVAANGREAVEIFRERAAQIDAVLLDLTMPELSGEETLRAIRKIDADVPVVLSSGFMEQEVAPRFEGVGVVGFLQKPYELAQLVRLLRLALEKRAK